MRAAGRPNGAVRTPRAISAMSDDHRRRGRDAAGARTDQRDRSETPSASIVTALVTPMTWAIADSFGTMVGCTRCSMPASVFTATPSSFTR